MSWAVAVAGIVGLVTGMLGVLAFTASQFMSSRPDTAAPVGELPDGVTQVLAVLNSAAIVLDRGDDVTTASPSAYAFGLVRGYRVVHTELLDMAGRARSEGLVHERELELPRGPLGRAKLVVKARVAPLGTDHVLVLVDDSTEARRLEEIRRDFVANVSHELKTPIGALQLLAEAVSGAADDPEAVAHFAARMERESRRLSVLVQEIIDLSRLQVADALHPPEPIEITSMVTEAVDRVRMAAESRDITLVEAADRGAVVFGDRELLVTALRNLVANAINYSEPGTDVSVTVERRAGLVEISVKDQGLGIPDAEQERIFERFYRVDPARSRATGGTGLGLSIVKHVAANHGGEVTLWSEVGIGSTFTLRLPDGARDVKRAVVPSAGGQSTSPTAAIEGGQATTSSMWSLAQGAVQTRPPGSVVERASRRTVNPSPGQDQTSNVDAGEGRSSS